MAVQNNFSKPAPRWWRNMEDGLLMLLIPAAVAIVMGWGFKDEAFVTKLTLLINVGLVALVKFIGKLMNSTEVYALPDTKTVEVNTQQTTTVVDTTKDEAKKP